jgi:chromosome segregation ATPase
LQRRREVVKWAVCFLVLCVCICGSVVFAAENLPPKDLEVKDLAPMQNAWIEQSNNLSAKSGAASQAAADTVIAIEAAEAALTKAKVVAIASKENSLAVVNGLPALIASQRDIFQAATACQVWAQKEYAKIIAQITGLQEELKIAKAALAAASGEASDLKAKIKALEASEAAAKSKLGALQTVVAAQASAAAAMKAALDAALAASK